MEAEGSLPCPQQSASCAGPEPHQVHIPHSVSRRVISIRVMKTNVMQYLSSVCFVNQPLHVAAIFVAHRQEVYCIYTATGISSVCFVNQPLHVSAIFVAHRQEVYCIYI
jgi:hypothetical protein